MVFDLEVALEIVDDLEQYFFSDIFLVVGELYVSIGDVKYLLFFKKNLIEVSGFFVIYFVDVYVELVVNSDLEILKIVVGYLNIFVFGESIFLWIKFGVICGLNEMCKVFEQVE